MNKEVPSYLELYNSGELNARIKESEKILLNCELCPNLCHINRKNNEIGKCKSKDVAIVSSYNAHYGEEPSISGIYGSGTIFFTNCTMRCIFCQNYPISQLGNGNETSIERLADIMLYLQSRKCHNINFVTPTHFMPQILKAIRVAIPRGFNLPIVYNTSGYERVEIIKILEGIIDIYLPDIKYSDNELAFKFSGVQDYVEKNQSAIKEMFRQVGFLKTNAKGIAIKGLLIRHLVLPNNVENSKKVLRFLAEEISTNVNIGIMSQYFPAYKAVNHPALKYRVTKEEYMEVIEYAEKLGFKNVLIQEI